MNLFFAFQTFLEACIERLAGNRSQLDRASQLEVEIFTDSTNPGKEFWKSSSNLFCVFQNNASGGWLGIGLDWISSFSASILEFQSGSINPGKEFGQSSSNFFCVYKSVVESSPFGRLSGSRSAKWIGASHLGIMGCLQTILKSGF